MTADTNDEELGERLTLVVPAALAGERLDRVLAELSGLSRARVQALMSEGGLEPVAGPAEKAVGGAAYALSVPPARPDIPEPQALPLTVLHEDADLIVIDKAAGMAAHPAPGTPNGTLVNALLHHCAGGLSGIGGVARPGIVHRLDKDTSGVMVAAKSDRAHQGLAALFAAHDLDREYLALTRGAPRLQFSDPASGRLGSAWPLKSGIWGVIETAIGRSPTDRKKMATLKTGGRRALTRYTVEQVYGPAERPLAARVRCRLETGRTHQIRVHLAHLGAAVLGDPVYGSARPVASVQAVVAASGLARQALHAAVLGFVHPVTGERLRFETAPPADMRALEAGLAAL